jgi:CMP-N-acetylneuraminic acid synthetase/quercetin dioxygenase-like cupin family protein
MKIVAMIPARLGSKRILKKNIRLLNNKPLISYVVDAAKEADCFDEIYINSESELLEEISDNHNIKFYKRSDYLASDGVTNDHFADDFLQNIDCDYLVQILPTSPFITPAEILNFVKKIKDTKCDTLISVVDQQIESMYNNKSINFDQRKITPPSQEVKPVQVYACSLMGWKKSNYLQNMEKHSAAYHGGEGKIETFSLKGYSTIDIDNEEDFQLAEVTAKHLSSLTKVPPQYYTSGQRFDSNRLRVLLEDGVDNNTMNEYNKEIASVKEILANNPKDRCWSHTLVNSKSTCATLIAQMPGEGNRLHYHSDWDEWWHILQGEWEWLVEGEPLTVKEGDIVYIERNRKHKITAIGDKQAIRLAVSREDVDHIYPGRS